MAEELARCLSRSCPVRFASGVDRYCSEHRDDPEPGDSAIRDLIGDHARRTGAIELTNPRVAVGTATV